MSALPADTVLLVIDVQKAFDSPRWGERNNLEAEANIGSLLAHWRAGARPVIHIRHRNDGTGGAFSPDAPGFAVKPEAEPWEGEPTLLKAVNSAFIGTDL
ncbi:MAG: hypothetical protein QOE58_1356, partial [Actinomycetota bacterium]|nr:hypothetical protein [Actinomycetota bacterium]